MIVKLTVEKRKGFLSYFMVYWGYQRHNGKRCEKVTRAKRVLRVIGIILAVVAVLFVILLVFLTVAGTVPNRWKRLRSRGRPVRP